MRKCLIILITLLGPLRGIAQEFEFQIDAEGKAYYCDSTRVLNSNPSDIYKKFVSWFRSQYSGNYDTLLFTQETQEKITLREVIPVAGTNMHYLSMLIIVDFTLDKISYCINEIYILSAPDEVPCLNLASDQPQCNFTGNFEEWKAVKSSADREITALVEKIQEFITS